jgi:hypothetical protein
LSGSEARQHLAVLGVTLNPRHRHGIARGLHNRASASAKFPRIGTLPRAAAGRAIPAKKIIRFRRRYRPAYWLACKKFIGDRKIAAIGISRAA